MRILIKDYIIEQAMKKLLHVQNVAAEGGDWKGTIKVSLLLIKLAKKYGNKLIDFSTIESNEYSNKPPNEGK